MRKWDYRSLVLVSDPAGRWGHKGLPIDNVDSFLSGFGDGGWELVAVTPEPVALGSAGLRYTFKRVNDVELPPV